jgi:DNA excision repair protein ERCC-2
MSLTKSEEEYHNYLQIKNTFPYQATPDQFQIIYHILKLQPQEKLMTHAPTGSGKSIASLTALFIKKKPYQKIIIFVRTIAQMEPWLREWSSISRTSKTTILPILGKNRMCTGSKNCSDCEFKTQIPDRLQLLQEMNQSLKIDPTTQQLKDFLSVKNYCPFYTHKSMIRHASIVLVPYVYLGKHFLHTLLLRMKTKIKNVLILVDEAHNLILETKITITHEEIVKIRQLIGSFPLLAKLEERMNCNRMLNCDTIAPVEQWESLAMSIQSFTPSDLDLMEIQPTDLKELHNLKTFLRERNEGTIISSVGKLDLLIPSPHLKLENLQESASQIYQSGTLTPIQHYRAMFGFKQQETTVLNLETEPPNNQLRCFFVGRGLTSKHNRKHEWLYKEMARTILELHQLSPRHTLVLCPSYAFKEEVVQHVKLSYEGILIEETETSTPEELSQLPLELKEPALLIGIDGGKIAEGNEWVRFGDSLVSLIIVAGLSYAPPNEHQVIIDRIRSKVAISKEIPKRFHQQIPQLRRIQQALGRTIRRDHDRGALVILDFRAERFLHKELRLRRITRFEVLQTRIQDFFEGYPAIHEV